MGEGKEFRLRAGAKICGDRRCPARVYGISPADWVLRTNLGFELDHFLAFFVLTLLVCVAWPPL